MNKIEKAQQIIKENDLDSWLIYCSEDSDIHSPYLLNVQSHSTHVILISTDGAHKILTTTMEAAMTEKAIKQNNYDIDVLSYSKRDEFVEKLKDLLKDKSKIALNYGENLFEDNSTSFADYIKAGQKASLEKLASHVEFSSAANIIKQMRTVKSEEEIEDLKQAVDITLEILENVPDWVEVGMTEKELQAKIYFEYYKVGGKPSFEAIIGTGAHAADPHHNTSTKKIEEGVLLIDTGVKLNQIGSDITWTYWVGNKPTEEFTNAYHALFESKEEALKYMKAGERVIEPAVKCREYLSKKGYDHEKLYIHGFGHALGFETHDIGSRMSWKAPEEPLLEERMIYTSEPGLYWPNKYGIRLEDDVVIRKDKGEVLSYNHRDPLQI